MRLDIRGLKMEVTEALREHIERRVDFALSRYAASIDRVDVRVTDINAAKGGVDKQCRIRASGRPSWQVYVSDTEADLYAAIDRAADRIGHSVGRTLGRKREAGEDQFATA